jgi:Ca-activated chloride channel family protein
MILGVLATLAAANADDGQDGNNAILQNVMQGALRIVEPAPENALPGWPAAPAGGVVECPLTHTDVKADISGFLARVRVTQTFKNPKDEKIEAVYVFPLPHHSAIDEMTMVIGERRIVGKVKRRDDARRIYQQALSVGQTAALLEQERPNIFTQSVGNIPPGATVRVEISYVDVLKYDQGEYEFSFPMVVGPRFNPGSASPPQPLNAELAGKAVPGGAATARVPDGDRINPPILRPDKRNGHDISLTVHLDAGVPVHDMKVASHEASIERPGNRRAVVKLNEMDSLPNKDFVLRYDVTGERPSMALLAHRPAGDASVGSGTPNVAQGPRRDGGYFLLMVQPADDERLTKSPPREIVFLVDVSGSMSGEPTQKVVQTMQHMLKLCRDGADTVQVVTFASQAHQLFERPVPVNPENIGKALQFTSGISAGGGTQMLEGVKLAMDQPIDPERVRIIIMLTDGYIGNEAEIIEHVGRRAGDQIRFWCVGIGASPNMFLVDGVARQGGGMGRQLNLNDDTQALATEVITRIQRAQLSNVEIDWGGLAAFDTYPAKLPELWAGRPLILFGRYRDVEGKFAVNVKGRVEGEPASWPLTVELPKTEPANDVLAPTWARQKIEDLMQSSFYAGSPAVEEAVTALALDYRLMSQYTSFVAVDDSQPAAEGPVAPPRRMLVPVPLPAGTRWEGFFGPEGRSDGRDFDVAENRRRQPSRAVDRLLLSRAPQAAEGASLVVSGPRSGFAVPQAATAAPRGGLQGQSVGGGFGGGSGLGGRGGFGGGGRWGGGGQRGAQGRGRARLEIAQQLGDRKRAGTLNFNQPISVGRREVLRGAFALDETLDRGGEAGAKFGLAVADKLASDAEVAWLIPPAQNSDPAAPIFAWEQTSAGAMVYDAIAREALAAGKKSAQAKDTVTAIREFTRAVYFAEAQASRRPITDDISGEALAELERLRDEQIAGWRKASPWLGTRMNLVLRDVRVDEAIRELLAEIRNAAGNDSIEIQLVADSLADVAALGGETQIHFLDLRRADLAEALDWILMPARLTWRLDGGKLIIGTSRRFPGVNIWVYDVADLTLPRHSELGDPANQAEYLAKAQQECDAILAAVRERIGSKENVQWFAPGQVLVIGEAGEHQRVRTFLAELADPAVAAKSDLHKLARERLAARKAAREESIAALQQLRALVALDDFAWPLLSAAARGDLNLEALTELQIAWKSLDRAKATTAADSLLLRTAWIAGEAAQALPAERELAEFAATLARETRELAMAAVAKISTTGEHPVEAQLSEIYALLAHRGQSEIAGGAYEAVRESKAGSNAWLTQAILPAVLGRGGDEISGELIKLVRSGEVLGEDAVVLTALACRRVGGEAWSTFRAESTSMLGQQPLAGDVIVLVSELSAARLPLVAVAR